MHECFYSKKKAFEASAAVQLAIQFQDPTCFPSGPSCSNIEWCWRKKNHNQLLNKCYENLGSYQVDRDLSNG